MGCGLFGLGAPTRLQSTSRVWITSVCPTLMLEDTYTSTPHMGYRPKIAASVDQQAAALKQIPFLFSSVQFTNCGTCCCRVQNCRAEFSMALGAGALALLSQRTQAAASGSGRLHAANCWGLGKQTRGCCRCLWHWHYTHTLPNKHWGLCFTLHFIIKPLQTI